MTRRLDDAVDRWLAEEAGEPGTASPELAEAALAEVFRRWPAPAPPRGFAMAVLRRSGLRRRPDVFASRWVHLLIGAGLALAGLALAALPAAARLVRLAFEPADLVGLGSRALVSVSRTFAGALDLWGFLSRLGDALGAAAVTPQAALSLILVALCAGGALRALNRLITAERSF
jgi:hypothetical protein